MVVNWPVCQTSKPARRAQPPLASYGMPDFWFDHVHIDSVGSPSGIELLCWPFSHWQYAFSTQGMTAETFMERWIAVSFIPLAISTDRGKQVESAFFTKLAIMLGTHRALSSSNQWSGRMFTPAKWTQVQSLVLLGIGTAVKASICCSAAEMSLCTPLRVPGQFFSVIPSESVA